MEKSISKASIVQRLLDKKQITAEEAVILLTVEHNINVPKPYTYPTTYPFPNPWFHSMNSTKDNTEDLS